MARIRTIKPEFFRHEGLYEAEQETGLPLRLSFAGLLTAADREGRFKWQPRQLKLDALPYDEVDFSRVLDALATRGHIVKYVVNGVVYGYIPSWHSHQSINNKESASVLPTPPEEPINTSISTREPRVLDALDTPLFPTQGEGKGKEGKGKDISLSSLRSDRDCDSQSGEAQKVAQRKTSGTPKRATALPDDYTPNQAATELAKELGVDLQAEFARFTDYYRAKGGAMKDWDAALRNWIRKAKEYANNAVKPFNYQSRESLRAIAAKSRLSDFLNDDGTMKSSGASDASDTHILGR